MVKLLDRQKYYWHDPSEDPLHLYYWPLIGKLYHLRLDRALSLLHQEHLQSPSRVLEVGYGSGTSFLELAERFDEIYGLDIHGDSDAVAKTFAREQIEVNLTQGSILAPPYPDDYFDAVLAISILEHLQPEEQPMVMQQVHRMLRPGGVFVVGVPELNRRMSAAFRMLGYDISQHHFSAPNTVLHAATQVFAIDQKVNLPAFAPDMARLYVWFVARKV